MRSETYETTAVESATITIGNGQTESSAFRYTDGADILEAEVSIA